MNLHASAVSVRSRGILITGRSGSGKTRLALALVREARLFGHAAQLVADDQVLLAPQDGRLLARVPPPISGLVEIRGFGILSVPSMEACVLDLILRLVPAGQAPRMAENATEELAGCILPRLDLPEGDAPGAVLAANAFLFGSPF